MPQPAAALPAVRRRYNSPLESSDSSDTEIEVPRRGRRAYQYRQHRSRPQELSTFNSNSNTYTLETWLHVLNGYFREIKIRRDTRKIDTLLYLLGKYPHRILQNYYTARDNSEEYPSSFQHAVDLLKAIYIVVDLSVEAVRKIETVKQEESQISQNCALSKVLQLTLAPSMMIEISKH